MPFDFSRYHCMVRQLLAFVLLCIPAMSRGDEPGDARRAMSRRIDQLLDERLRELGWQPAGECSDASFLRRAALDLTGTPPTATEVTAFVEDRSADKRQRLVSRLLSSNQSANHLAETWAGWMLPEDNVALFGLPDDGLRTWLRNRFAENLRYDRLVSDLMVSTGPAQTGPTSFFVALEGKPEKLAAKTARVFMGVQLDCAQCHDHPFDDWKQRDFWGLAAYFAQLSTGGDQPGMGPANVVDLAEGSVTLPGTDEVIEPQPLVQAGVSGLNLGTRRQQLSLWLTAPENPFLAQATVNRVWSLLMGRGLIEPIDDMRSVDMASHPQLLKELSEYFASTGYDLRNLIVTIATTRAYSRATLHPAGEIPEASYAAMLTKPQTERQLSKSLSSIARQLSGGDQATQARLENQLGKLRGDASEAKLGIVSALVTLHGEDFDQVSRDGSSRLLLALSAPHLDDLLRVKWMYLSVLNRSPTTEELQYFSAFANQHAAAVDSESENGEQAHGEEASEPVQASELSGNATVKEWHSDLLWALLNSTEFAMTP